MNEEEAFDKFWKEDSGWYSEPDLSCSEKMLARDAWKAALAHYRNDVAELVEAVERACDLYFTDLDDVECEDVVIDAREQAIDDLMALWRDKLAAKLKDQP